MVVYLVGIHFSKEYIIAVFSSLPPLLNSKARCVDIMIKCHGNIKRHFVLYCMMYLNAVYQFEVFEISESLEPFLGHFEI